MLFMHFLTEKKKKHLEHSGPFPFRCLQQWKASTVWKTKAVSPSTADFLTNRNPGEILRVTKPGHIIPSKEKTTSRANENSWDCFGCLKKTGLTYYCSDENGTMTLRILDDLISLKGEKNLVTFLTPAQQKKQQIILK